MYLRGTSSEVVYLLISRGERCGEAVASVGTEPRALGGFAGIAPFLLLSPSQPAASGAPCSSVAQASARPRSGSIGSVGPGCMRI